VNSPGEFTQLVRSVVPSRSCDPDRRTRSTYVAPSPGEGLRGQRPRLLHRRRKRGPLEVLLDFAADGVPGARGRRVAVLRHESAPRRSSRYGTFWRPLRGHCEPYHHYIEPCIVNTIASAPQCGARRRCLSVPGGLRGRRHSGPSVRLRLRLSRATENCPETVMRSARWWPWDLPSGGHQRCAVR